ncbi:MAG: DNA starvation/stationary phase protection protein [Candidatus Binatia bacterium]|nr:MAG: DNA starvation/stationary phase protection protein [Candidatus Binatia bacterium]
MRVNIGLTEQQREAVCAILRALLADEFVLYTKARNYHWNVVGPQFHDLHKLFEEQYEALDDIVDEVAERIRSLGGVAPGTLEEFRQAARLREEPGKVPSAREMVRNLAEDHEAIVRQLRQDIAATQDQHHDVGTADFLTGLMERHEKYAWMLRATATES